MDQRDQQAIDEMVYWFLYGMKLGRVKEEIKFGSGPDIKFVNKDVRDLVEDYNDLLGQKV